MECKMPRSSSVLIQLTICWNGCTVLSSISVPFHNVLSRSQIIHFIFFSVSIFFIIPFASLKAQTRYEKNVMPHLYLGIAIHHRARKGVADVFLPPYVYMCRHLFKRKQVGLLAQSLIIDNKPCLFSHRMTVNIAIPFYFRLWYLWWS